MSRTFMLLFFLVHSVSNILLIDGARSTKITTLYEVFVTEGGSVMVNCSNKAHQELPYLKDKSYIWTYEGKRLVGSLTLQFKKENITLSNVGTEKAGEYCCWMEATDSRNDQRVSYKFFHRLYIYQMPLLLHTVKNYFKASKCNQTKDADLSLAYKHQLCRNTSTKSQCQFRVSYSCDQTHSLTEIAVEFGYPKHMQLPVCDVECINGHLKKQITNITNYVVRSWLNISQIYPKLSKWFVPHYDLQQEASTSTCAMGYEWHQYTFCVTCFPGSYFDKPMLSCQQCPNDYYRETGGAIGSCTKCRSTMYTVKKGSKSKEDCIPKALKKALEKPIDEILELKLQMDHYYTSEPAIERGMIVLKMLLAFVVLLIFVFGVCIVPVVIVSKVSRYNNELENRARYNQIDESKEREPLSKSKPAPAPRPPAQLNPLIYERKSILK